MIIDEGEMVDISSRNLLSMLGLVMRNKIMTRMAVAVVSDPAMLDM